MQEIQIGVEALGRLSLLLGKAGEHRARAYKIDIGGWTAEYPDARVELYATPAEGEAYMADVRREGDVVTWVITGEDTVHPGVGSAELILRDARSGAVLKSATARTVLVRSPSQEAAGEPPEAHRAWWERVLEEIAAIGENGVVFETDETLNLEHGVLSVNTADRVEQDNSLPVTSGAVYTEVGNINALLETI